MPRACLFLAAAAVVLCGQTPSSVEQWGTFELSLRGPTSGNPFIDVTVSAEFRMKNRTVAADGFYDGDGVYRIRFMPDVPGTWTYRTHSNRPELDDRAGQLIATAPRAGNHGPVRVSHTYHFAYADGTPYVVIGTTSYAWAHQGNPLEERTLETLRSAPFNKMRMCVFPKDYVYNKNEPEFYPFPRVAGRNDFTRFEPKFFQHLEKRVKELMNLGIEADLILFHPYDRWGYKVMGAEVDDRYLRYVVARLAAYRNVWWSIANEFDFIKEKSMPDWDRYFRIVQESDPYQHLRSIHNGTIIYDHSKPWVTHASIQHSDFERTRGWLEAYRKPVVFDECQYEGNIPRRWGNISAREMVRRFWLAATNGAYGGHGETYLDPNDVLWWSKGGVLKGESPRRIAFLRKILEQGPAEGIDPYPDKYPAAAVPGKYYLYYLDSHQPAEYEFDLVKRIRYQLDIIDPWDMTITPVAGNYEGKFTAKLPGKPYMALRIREAAK